MSFGVGGHLAATALATRYPPARGSEAPRYVAYARSCSPRSAFSFYVVYLLEIVKPIALVPGGARASRAKASG